MLISGGKIKDNAPFRVVNGHGAFVVPPFRKAKMLTLASKKALVTEPCYTKEAFEVMVKAVIVFHVPGTDTPSIIAAGQRFVREESEMEVVTGEIFAGHLRSIVGTLTLQELLTNREAFEHAVLESSKTEMVRIGLEVDSLKIQTIDDGGRGFIAALAAPHTAELQRAAAVAQAEATRASTEAEQESVRRQAEYERDIALRQAEYKAETDKASAIAAQSGPLAAAEAQQKVLEMESELAQRRAALREQELQTEVIKPADAEAERVRIDAEARSRQTQIDAEARAKKTEVDATAEARRIELSAGAAARQAELEAEGRNKAARLNAEAVIAEGNAEADRERAVGLAKAEAAKAQADAAAANDAVSLQQLLIESLPAVVAAATAGLKDANVTMLDGADSYSKLLASGVQQGLSIWNVLKSGVLPNEAGEVTKAPNPAEFLNAVKNLGGLSDS